MAIIPAQARIRQHIFPNAHSRANGNPVKHTFLIVRNNLSTGFPLFSLPPYGVERGREWTGGVNACQPRQSPKIGVRPVLVIILCFALAACGEVGSAPSESSNRRWSRASWIPFTACRPGRFRCRSAALTLTLPDARKLPVRALYGSCLQSCPVLLFSHGFGSDNTEYDRLLEHWAGYDTVVLAPDHADSGGMLRAIFSSIRYGQYGLIERRIEDLDHVLDRLHEIAETIDRRIDARRVIAAGHSFGAFSAQQLVGAGAYNPDTGRYDYPVDPRVIAAVAVSPPRPHVRPHYRTELDPGGKTHAGHHRHPG